MTALGRALKRLTDVEMRVLVMTYVDVTGTLDSTKKLMSAQTLARGVRGDGDVKMDLPTGMVVAVIESVKWPEIVSNADGRVKKALRDQLRASALTLDEQDKIEEQVAGDESSQKEGRGRALGAHLHFVADEVAKEVSAARRKLRNALLEVDLDVTPRLLISRQKSAEAPSMEGQIGSVCFGATIENGLRGACQVRQARLPEATALCSYCKSPKAN